jgi:hypothetical protein
MVIHTRPEMSHPRQDMTHAHQTAPTQFVEANGIRFAYRRFGKSGGMPLVFNQHFMGTMDHWDPAVTDGLAKTREVNCADWRRHGRNAAWMLGYFIAARFANFACRFARSSGHRLEPVAIRLHTGGCRRALDCTVGALGRYDVTPSSTCLMRTPAFLNGINVILHASFRRDTERAGPSFDSRATAGEV